MKSAKHPNLIYGGEAIGFLMIITLSWLNELIGLPSLLLEVM